MSLTSYRAAPSRVNQHNHSKSGPKVRKAERPPRLIGALLATDVTKQ
jgi:hypothetical protein